MALKVRVESSTSCTLPVRPVSLTSAVGVPKNCVTYTFSSLSSVSPSLVMASARGCPPTSVVPSTVMSDVCTKVSVPSPKLATTAMAPVGESATPVGSLPSAVRVPKTTGVTVSMAVTFASCRLRRSTTKAVVLSG